MNQIQLLAAWETAAQVTDSIVAKLELESISPGPWIVPFQLYSGVLKNLNMRTFKLLCIIKLHIIHSQL